MKRAARHGPQKRIGIVPVVKPAAPDPVPVMQPRRQAPPRAILKPVNSPPRRWPLPPLRQQNPRPRLYPVRKNQHQTSRFAASAAATTKTSPALAPSARPRTIQSPSETDTGPATVSTSGSDPLLSGNVTFTPTGKFRPSTRTASTFTPSSRLTSHGAPGNGAENSDPSHSHPASTSKPSGSATSRTPAPTTPRTEPSSVTTASLMPAPRISSAHASHA